MVVVVVVGVVGRSTSHYETTDTHTLPII